MEVIQLEGQPSAPDCMAWSADNIIAIAVRERVALLVSINDDAQASKTTWKTIYLDVGSFTEDEFPLLEPEAWSSFSLTEEQSERHVAALSWSPSGLGLHGRCVLAVLTGNDVLSLWECQGKPDATGDWHRILIINDALAQVSDATRSRRIRSYDWAPSPNLLPRLSSTHSESLASVFFLAISNDNAEIVLLGVSNPYDLLASARGTWKVEKITSFSPASKPNRVSSLARCLPTTLDTPNMPIDGLAWSQWIRDIEDVLVATLAYTCHSEVMLKTVRLTSAAIQPTLSVDDSFAGAQLHPTKLLGPLLWLPKPTSVGGHELCYITNQGLHALHIQHAPAEHSQSRRSSSLIDVWHQAVGICPAIDGDRNALVVMAPDRCNLAGTGPLLQLKAHPLADEPRRFGSKVLQDQYETYLTRQPDMRDRLVATVHGLATSPVGDIVATTVSFHPSEGLEYTIPAREESFVSFSRELYGDKSVLPGTANLHFDGNTVEGIIGSIRRAPVPTISDESQETIIVRRIGEMLYSSHEEDTAATPENDSDLEALTIWLRNHLVYGAASVSARAQRIFELAYRPTAKSRKNEMTCIQQLASNVLSLPSSILDSTDMSKRISAILRTVLGTLQAREGGSQEAQPTTATESPELCALCGSNVPFESLRWAQCSKNHQFARCSLSFLAIQSPGKAKSCGVCGMQYLNERKLAELQPTQRPNEANLQSDQDVAMQGTEAATVGEPLLRILFSACDRCLYCGGKFVG